MVKTTSTAKNTTMATATVEHHGHADDLDGFFFNSEKIPPVHHSGAPAIYVDVTAGEQPSAPVITRYS
jgi:hypothetical protein